MVRATHWMTALCFFALLLSGLEIVISHPRFYWGESGNVHTPALFQLPIPASRAMVKTGYNFVMPDQNGWSRALHFQAAWLVLLTGLLYGIHGLARGHFRRNLWPAGFSWTALRASLVSHWRGETVDAATVDGLTVGGATVGGSTYNLFQRLTYLMVIAGLFPLMIWTGLAMSPAFTAAFPATVDLLGGQQSARTIHFFVTLALVLFVLVHVVMVWRTGFRRQMRAMTIGKMEQEGA